MMHVQDIWHIRTAASAGRREIKHGHGLCMMRAAADALLLVARRLYHRDSGEKGPVHRGRAHAMNRKQRNRLATSVLPPVSSLQLQPSFLKFISILSKTTAMSWFEKVDFLCGRCPEFHISYISKCLCCAWLMQIFFTFNKSCIYIHRVLDSRYHLIWTKHNSSTHLKHKTMFH